MLRAEVPRLVLGVCRRLAVVAEAEPEREQRPAASVRGVLLDASHELLDQAADRLRRQPLMLGLQLFPQRHDPDGRRDRVHERVEERARSLRRLAEPVELLDEPLRDSHAVEERFPGAIAVVAGRDGLEQATRLAQAIEDVMGDLRVGRQEPVELRVAQGPTARAEIGEPRHGAVPVSALEQAARPGERQRQAGPDLIVGQRLLGRRIDEPPEQIDRRWLAVVVLREFVRPGDLVEEEREVPIERRIVVGRGPLEPEAGRLSSSRSRRTRPATTSGSHRASAVLRPTYATMRAHSAIASAPIEASSRR
jgi:hypothetical protein